MKKLSAAILIFAAVVGVALSQGYRRWHHNPGGGDTGVVYTEGRIFQTQSDLALAGDPNHT